MEINIYHKMPLLACLYHFIGRCPISVQEMCVSRPRWCAAFPRENAKTRKRENGQQNAKTRKRENSKTRTEVQERESWTAMIISGSSGTSMQNNYIALQ